MAQKRGGIVGSTMNGPRIVLDTNVLVAGLRSRQGASFRLLSGVGGRRFEIALSVPLVLEYEDVLLRQRTQMKLTVRDVGVLLDYLCSVGVPQRVFYLWRPQLPDPGDDFVLELAVAASCEVIVTHNLRDFTGTARFGIKAMTPAAFLRHLGDLP